MKKVITLIMILVAVLTAAFISACGPEPTSQEDLLRKKIKTATQMTDEAANELIAALEAVNMVPEYGNVREIVREESFDTWEGPNSIGWKIVAFTSKRNVYISLIDGRVVSIFYGGEDYWKNGEVLKQFVTK